MSSFKGFESDLYNDLIAGEYEVDEPDEPGESDEDEDREGDNG